ncbi:glutathione S-transferase [Nevskia sp.]|uniref:glutathione S-transferase n=1 Tax=Nevskia sp. TaxID=1929292 RepID=UPI0025EE26D9|nr:glutathione S-transferase [Nevskia sp.]
MIVVHHLENSRSQRILWLLEELGLPYTVKRYERDKKTMLAPPELKTVHPLGKSPVISDDGVVIAETGAIIEHLIERHGNGRLMPAAGTPEYIRYRYWLHYAEGSLMPLLVMKLIFSKTTVAPTPWLIRPIARAIANGVGRGYLDPSLKLHLTSIETALGDSGWFAGSELTAADIIMSFPLEAAAARGGASQGYPNILNFLARIKARPAWQAALGKGGPYQLMR